MSEKNYVGSGKKVGNYDLVNFSIQLDRLNDFAFEMNGKKYVKLSMGRKKEVDQYGKTHSIWIDEWKPDATTQAQPQKAETDLPF
ncbi:hypothetical protein [uncultured Mediterranean phage uvDeep1-CGR2-KM23-C896]|jgi:hypothetical protein|nr:hypothetical protein [uncultured Mediterranean phage uvDeep1-CGR2-KM23-C896]|tara:strand:+ start:1067 stop:1321 length:255 start_codon:yes stop_codon:yes gene_type:complete